MVGVACEHSTAVILGMPKRVADGIANSAICMNQRGRIAGSYRKTHLYGGV